MSLTDKEKNLLILQKCGWRRSPMYDAVGIQQQLIAWAHVDGRLWWEDMLPDCINNIKDVHDAWMSFPDDIRISFHQKLMDIVDSSTGKSDDGLSMKDIVLLEQWVIWTFEANAKQRSEAIGQTLNLWKKGD